MNKELISLIVGWVIIAGFLIVLEILDRRQKGMNKIRRDGNKITKNKRF